MFRKLFALAAAPAAAVAGSALLAAAASAAPVFADTSVTAFGSSVDAITGITAQFDSTSLGASTVVGTAGTPIGGSHTLTFTAPGGSHGALTWTATEANFPGFSFSLVSNVLTVTAPVHVSAINPSALPTIQVTATDGTAVAKDTLTVTAGTVIATGPSAGDVDTLTIAQAPDTVTLSSVNNNTSGNVDFTTVPAAGVSLALHNAPGGTALSGDSLVAASSVPGTYHGVTVTASDAAGAVAVDTMSIRVKGAVVANDTPRLSHGHAVCISATREWVYFVQSGSPSWDHFTIVGPGAINGHQGWVNGQLGLNRAFYAGLEAHHGYTVFFQPVTGQGSVTPVPGSRTGAVFFVSDTDC